MASDSVSHPPLYRQYITREPHVLQYEDACAHQDDLRQTSWVWHPCPKWRCDPSAAFSRGARKRMKTRSRAIKTPLSVFKIQPTPPLTFKNQVRILLWGVSVSVEVSNRAISPFPNCLNASRDRSLRDRTTVIDKKWPPYLFLRTQKLFDYLLL